MHTDARTNYYDVQRVGNDLMASYCGAKTRIAFQTLSTYSPRNQQVLPCAHNKNLGSIDKHHLTNSRWG